MTGHQGSSPPQSPDCSLPETASTELQMKPCSHEVERSLILTGFFGILTLIFPVFQKTSGPVPDHAQIESRIRDLLTVTLRISGKQVSPHKGKLLKMQKGRAGDWGEQETLVMCEGLHDPPIPWSAVQNPRGSVSCNKK